MLLSEKDKRGETKDESKRWNNINSINNYNNSYADIGSSNSKCSIKWRAV